MLTWQDKPWQKANPNSLIWLSVVRIPLGSELCWDEGTSSSGLRRLRQAFLSSPVRLYLITISFPPVPVLVIQVIIFPMWVELGCKVVHRGYAELYNSFCFKEGSLKLNIGVRQSQSWNLRPDPLWRCSWVCAGRRAGCYTRKQRLLTWFRILNWILSQMIKFLRFLVKTILYLYKPLKH